MQYKVLDLDVWAAEEEGLWDVNNWHSIGEINIPDSFDSDLIIERMIDENYLNAKARNLVEAEDTDDCTIRVLRKDDYKPVFDLVLVEEV